MRRWSSAAALSGRLVSEHPELWLPGALAWVATIGWIPFVVATVRPPSVAELTLLGAGIVSSGAWPWNAALIGAVGIGLVLLAVLLAAAADAELLADLDRRAASRRDVARLVAVRVVAAVPAALCALALLLAVAAVAPREFNAPEPDGGPVLRTLVVVAPVLFLLGLATSVGGAVAAIAGWRAIRRREGVARALRSAPGLALRPALATHAVVAFLSATAVLGIATLLLVVLWAPIGALLAGGGGIDLPVSLLLVGFVAIWLCVILAGGALHAWSAATWSRLLATDDPEGRVSTWKT